MRAAIFALIILIGTLRQVAYQLALLLGLIRAACGRASVAFARRQGREQVRRLPVLHTCIFLHPWRGILFAIIVVWSATAHAQLVWWYVQTFPTQGAALTTMQNRWGLPTASVLYGTINPGPAIAGMGTSVVYEYGTPLTLGADTYGYAALIPGDATTAASETAMLAAAESDITQYVHSASSDYSTCQVATATPGPWGGLAIGPANNASRTYMLTWSGASACAAWNNYMFPITRVQSVTCPTPTGGLVISATPMQGVSLPDYNAADWVCSAPQLAIRAYPPSLECPANNGPAALIGDPCDVASREYFATERDYSAAGLEFSRFYHSAGPPSFPQVSGGGGWTHNYGAQLIISSSIPVAIVRPDGHRETLTLAGSVYISSATGLHVAQSGNNWVVSRRDGTSELYNASGQLTQLTTPAGLVTTLTYGTGALLSTVADPFGHVLQFTYDSSSRLSKLMEPDGASSITYAYDSNSNLTSATYPDGTARQYQYQDTSFPNNLTGILDESGTQLITVQYDASTGAVVSSQQAGGAQAIAITYPTPGSAVVTDALGGTTTYQFNASSYFSPRLTSLQHNSLLQSYTVPAVSSDPQQRVTQSTDANGNITTYSYDTDHLTSKTEAYGTVSARTTSYQYLTTNTALPTLVTETLRTTAYAYYPNTNTVQTNTVTDLSTNLSRTWTYTYDSYGRMLTAKGPRTDVNSTGTYAYYTCTTGYQCGQLQTVTDALGQVTTYNTYNAHGQPLAITDPNGVVTTLTYDLRQRLTSRNISGETTRFAYYPTGLLETVTLPDGSSIQYTYDGAHRLVQMNDGIGNKVVYTLDGMGNRIAENAYDPSGILHRTHSRVFNALNQLYQDVSAAGTAAVTTTYAYDNNGNQTAIDAPLGRNTANAYDPLNRLAQVTDPASGNTSLAYDAENDLTSVQDPRGLLTSYAYDGFGDLTSQLSPDTGATADTYDSAGNLSTSTDARGAVATYSYDALNRVISVAYSKGGVADQTISFTYDAGPYGKGHLTGASDANHLMSWTYDALGRVTAKSQTVNGITKSVAYAYTNADLTSLTTPSGQTIAYGYNSNHQITSITVNGSPLLSNVTYEPFGQVNGWNWGNGTIATRSYDTDEKISQISSNGVKSYTYDDAFRITVINDTELGASNWTYGYDLLDRLTSAAGGGSTFAWTYDANGNRLTQTGSSASTYTISSINNQIASIAGATGRRYSYDAAGNMLGYGATSVTYNNRGRMITAANSSRGVSSPYVYNAIGQLIETNLNTVGIRLFWYDEAGHYLGVYNGSGGLGDETAWLGDIPVGTIVPNGHSVNVYYVHTDHLNTPRQVTRASDNTQMWTWFSDPFGTTAENQNPQGAGTLNYPPRLPGQLSTTEVAGLYQNYFRDYDPAVGRYVEPDPLLHAPAGFVNSPVSSNKFLVRYPQLLSSYNYVLDSPVKGSDRYGLGPIEWLQKLWESTKCAKAINAVRNAKNKCSGECPVNAEPDQTAEFIDKYAINGTYTQALAACVCGSMPETCAEAAGCGFVLIY
jgi:RHS repeat-associated protein